MQSIHGKKEIVERDYSSPVISLALEKKLIKFSDFENLSTEKNRRKAVTSIFNGK